jgi:hypothetical protein
VVCLVGGGGCREGRERLVFRARARGACQQPPRTVELPAFGQGQARHEQGQQLHDGTISVLEECRAVGRRWGAWRGKGREFDGLRNFILAALLATKATSPVPARGRSACSSTRLRAQGPGHSLTGGWSVPDGAMRRHGRKKRRVRTTNTAGLFFLVHMRAPVAAAVTARPCARAARGGRKSIITRASCAPLAASHLPLWPPLPGQPGGRASPLSCAAVWPESRLSCPRLPRPGKTHWRRRVSKKATLHGRGSTLHASGCDPP